MLDSQGEAVEQFPDISAETEAAEATGTDGTAVLGSCLATQAGSDWTEQDQSGQVRSAARREVDSRKPFRTRAKGPVEAEEGMVRAQGIEPWTYGLRVPFGPFRQRTRNLWPGRSL